MGGKREPSMRRKHYAKKVGYRPRRSGATPTVAQPEGPKAFELDIVESFHPEAMDYVTIAVEQLLAYRCNELEEPKVWATSLKKGLHLKSVPANSAEDIIAAFCDHVADLGWLEWKTMLNVVRDIALANPRYLGITDPTTQLYCSKCRKVKKLNEFPHGRVRCYDCGTWGEDASI